ncbi:DEAD/DEAH box helicase [Rhodobacteraceae bacterium WD3A24]|nr:DEAD/DEAH box helicase [Rhodobacteraceae bacterium WD3A24]
MTKFSDLKLDPKVLKAVEEAGYETPTPIQEQAIPHALEGRDVLGIAQTGTGKTASFTLPLITMLRRGRARARMPRSLVLAPTRELAAQVAESFETYAKYTKLSKALLIGGVSFKEQDALIDKGVDVLIATPGRLLDHFERGKLLLTGVQIMVVDEADRMLDMGFIPDIERIFGLTPFTRQTLFYSATMAPEIERITNTFLQAPVRIEVARQATASETIEQRLIELSAPRRDAFKAKADALRAVIQDEGEDCRNAIIFCNRKIDVDTLAKSLKKHGLDAAPIHGDLDQSLRTRTLEGFRDGTLRFLVASDVAARGLDIPAVSHVINFDVPSHPEDYVHRIGRTGRAGMEGRAITLATASDEKYIAAIESLLQKTIPRAPAPGDAAAAQPAEPAEETAEAATAPQPEKPKRRRRSRKAEEKPAPAQDTAPPTPEAPAEEAAPTPAAPTQGDEEAPAAPAEKAADAPSSGARKGRDRRAGKDKDSNKDKRDEPVVGMGDHVPDFLLREFRPSSD